MKPRPIATYIPIAQALREVFRSLDQIFAGMPVAYRPSTREAAELLCLTSGLPIANFLDGKITRDDMVRMTVHAAALMKMEIAFVELVWPPEWPPPEPGSPA